MPCWIRSIRRECLDHVIVFSRPARNGVHQRNTRLMTQRSPRNAIPEQLTLRAAERQNEGQKATGVMMCPDCPRSGLTLKLLLSWATKTFATCCNGFLKVEL